MEVFLSLASATLYGAADFLGGLVAKRAAVVTVTVASQVAGLILLLALLPFLHAAPVASDYLWGAAAGVCGGIGIALLYHALSIGRMGVVSPITAVLAAAFPVIVSAVRGDHLNPSQWIGIGLAFVAIVLISMSAEPSGEREIGTAGVKEAIASGLVLGMFLLFLANTHPAAGLHNLLAARAASISVLIAIALVTRVPLIPKKSDIPMLALCGAIDMSANALYVLATMSGALSIAAVLTSLYPASTVFLARVVLKERLSMTQRVGVAFALGGVALIAWR